MDERSAMSSVSLSEVKMSLSTCMHQFLDNHTSLLIFSPLSAASPCKSPSHPSHLVAPCCASVTSVLKSGPVRFFAFFGCNQTETSPNISTHLRNCNCNCTQPVACGCVTGCDQLQLVAYRTGSRLHATRQNRQSLFM